MAFFQMVVWNHRVEVMNMMEANVSREPLHDLGKFVVTASFHRCGGEVPVFTLCPVSILELVLNIEQPNSTPPGHAHHDGLENKKGYQAINHTHGGTIKQEGKVHQVNGSAFARFALRGGKPLKHEEKKQGGQPEKDEWITQKSIA